MAVTDDPDQAPGLRHLVRIFSETLHAHDEALAEGGDLTRQLTPTRWSGEASDEYATKGLARLDHEWQVVAAVSRGVTDQIDGYNNFVHVLRELWSTNAHLPAERARLRELWLARSHTIADELLAKAAELDALGHRDHADPVTPPPPASPVQPPGSTPPRRDREPDEPAGPTRHQPPAEDPITGSESGSDAISSDGADTGSDSADDAADDATDDLPDDSAGGSADGSPDDSAASDGGSGGERAETPAQTRPFSLAYRFPQRLRAQVLAGERRDYIPWG